jgi:hypothetical protein
MYGIKCFTLTSFLIRIIENNGCNRTTIDAIIDNNALLKVLDHTKYSINCIVEND